MQRKEEQKPRKEDKRKEQKKKEEKRLNGITARQRRGQGRKKMPSSYPS